MGDRNLSELIAEKGNLAIPVLVAFALHNRFPLALWRLPNSTESFLLIQANTELLYAPDLTPANQSGFALSPFWTSEKGLLLLNPDLLVKFTSEGANVIHSVSYAEELLKEFQKNELLNLNLNWHQSTTEVGQAASQTDYTSLVQKGVKAITEGQLEKVVLSRFKEVNLAKQPDLIQLWKSLCEEYPNTFASLISVPELGTWVGATPELLLEVKENRYFRTVALAGTQKACDETGELAVTWSHKEIEEQALVSRYIINCFKTIRLREYEEKGPRTITAGRVRHLQTTFSVDMQATGFPELPGQMLRLLHPTSAVGGMPRQVALQFIKENENYNRQLYSGFFGPVNIEGYTALFVNLRCLQAVNQKVLLYAGAGITQDSDPEKEWLETELKSSVLQRVLESLPNS